MKNTLPIALQLSLFLSIFMTDLTRVVKSIPYDEATHQVEHSRTLKKQNWSTVRMVRHMRKKRK